MFIVVLLLIALGAIYYLANDPSALKKLKELTAQPTGKDTKITNTPSMPLRSGRKELSTRTALLDETQTKNNRSRISENQVVGPSPSTEALKKQVENIEATTPLTAIHANDTTISVSKENNRGRMNLKDHHRHHTINNPSTN